jgi:CTP synthase
MLENAGLHFVGCDESGKRMEVLRKQHMPFLS